MKPRDFLVAWLLTLVLFLALDAAWLSFMLERVYRPALGHLLAHDVDWRPAALFYLLYAAGITAFAIAPARRASDAGTRGVAMGLLAYATYDLSNQATLPGWPWHVTLVDLAWGAIATGIAAHVTTTLLLAHRERN